MTASPGPAKETAIEVIDTVLVTERPVRVPYKVPRLTKLKHRRNKAKQENVRT